MKIGNAIRDLRGLRSQAEFAEEVGTHRVTISLWETGEANPSYKHARRLVELGLDRSLFLPAARPTSDDGAAA